MNKARLTALIISITIAKAEVLIANNALTNDGSIGLPNDTTTHHCKYMYFLNIHTVHHKGSKQFVFTSFLVHLYFFTGISHQKKA